MEITNNITPQLSNYIYQYPKSLSSDFCDEIINAYENETNKYEGVTRSGMNKSIKDTTDFRLNHFEDTPEHWKNIDIKLYSELTIRVNEYIKMINNEENYKKENNYNELYENIPVKVITDDGFLIQKYKKNSGKYVYHDDFSIHFETKRHRIITYLWYLNDIDEGGHTEFWGHYKVKPEKGKLIFFPACWCFPHRGNMPISNDKYIITGWFYVEHNKLPENMTLFKVADETDNNETDNNETDK